MLPGPPLSGTGRSSELRAQLQALVSYSASLSDTWKIAAEFWTEHHASLRWRYFFLDALESRGADIPESLAAILAHGMAAMNTQKAVWNSKRVFDSGRPISLIRCELAGSVQAWRGPYRGSQSIAAASWLPFVSTPPSPGYVSEVSALSTASAAVAVEHFGQVFRGASVTVAVGASRIEPKLTAGQAGYIAGLSDVANRGPGTPGYSPALPVTLSWATWEDAASNAASSQLYAGWHIESDVTDGVTLGRQVAASTVSYTHQLLTGGAAAVRYLSNDDFRQGTLILDTPGIYRLVEDITFEPNPPTSTQDAYSSFGPTPSQFASQGGRYSDQNYALGFFAAVSIVASDVTLDLNGFTLQQGVGHALFQRFFALIELNNQPFMAGQGPHDFGNIVAASRVEIKNGILGLSAHHSIHGNGNSDIIIRDIEFVDFELSAISLNGVEGLLVERCSATNRKDIPVIGTFSNARFIRPYVDYLVSSASLTKIRVNSREYTPQQIQTSLRNAMNNVYDDVVVKQLGYISQATHPDEYRLFHNPRGLFDGCPFLIIRQRLCDLGGPTRPSGQ